MFMQKLPCTASPANAGTAVNVFFKKPALCEMHGDIQTMPCCTVEMNSEV